MGHEVAATVESIGEGVTGWKAGDRAGVPWLYSTCGECEYCQAGREPLCGRQQITGVTVDGGYAEYMLARSAHAVRIPAALDPVEAAPLMCAGLTVYRAVRRSEVRAGETISIYGIGGLGHLAVQIARARSVEVCAVDVAEDKLELARECGASSTILAGKEKVPRTHVAMVCSASAAAYQAALGSLRKGGTLVVVGMPAEPIPVNAFKLVGGELRIIASAVGTRAELTELLDLAASGGVRCRVRTHQLGDVNAVLDALRAGSVPARAVLLPHRGSGSYTT
jgi:propanol-preferring alcohol dehydrogenase